MFSQNSIHQSAFVTKNSPVISDPNTVISAQMGLESVSFYGRCEGFCSFQSFLPLVVKEEGLCTMTCPYAPLLPGAFELGVWDSTLLLNRIIVHFVLVSKVCWTWQPSNICLKFSKKTPFHQRNETVCQLIKWLGIKCHSLSIQPVVKRP